MDNAHGVTQGKPIKGRVKHAQVLGKQATHKTDCDPLRQGFAQKPATTVEQLRQLPNPNPTEQAQLRLFNAHDAAQELRDSRHGATIEWHARLYPATDIFALPDTEYGNGEILTQNGEILVVKFKGFHKTLSDYGETRREYIPSETHAYQVTAVFPPKQDGSVPVNAIRLAEWPTRKPR